MQLEITRNATMKFENLTKRYVRRNTNFTQKVAQKLPEVRVLNLNSFFPDDINSE